jgi:hypothetical protein
MPLTDRRRNQLTSSVSTTAAVYSTSRDSCPCDACSMNLRASTFGPATTRTQAVVGALVAFALALLIGLGLKQGADPAVFTAGLTGVAVLMIGVQRARRARR